MEIDTMNSLETITEFLAWCTAINFGILLLAAFVLTVMRSWIVKVHTRIFGLNEEDLSRAYVQYLAHYKIAIIMLNFVPWVALKIIA
jgi:hypothetical protein